ncbi:MAG: YebC/PmpR family DNA-binding transcriptional regulator [Bacteroidota bacterium]
MSGHSKWANIKRRKGAVDAKRGRLFGKLVTEIIAAVRQGGASPDGNPRLRLAIQNAKGANVPKDNIERAIAKGHKSDHVAYETVTYEGYAPYGIAMIVACVTDNLNRTVAAVRAAFTKCGGSLSKSGSLAHLFDRKGVFVLSQQSVPDQDALDLAMIEAEAEAITSEEDYLYVTCPLEAFGSVQKALEALQLVPESATLQYIPHASVAVQGNAAATVMKLIEALEDNVDVQTV